MKHIAITGTNGKTSTLVLAHQLLNASGNSVASLGTLGLKIEDVLEDEPVLMGDRPMEAFLEELHYFHDVDAFLFEAYSVALANGKYDGIPIDVALLTNLDADHLDVHKNIEAYRAAKYHLFQKLLKPNGTAVCWENDSAAHIIKGICAERGCRLVSFGTDTSATLRLLKSTKSKKGTEVLLQYHQLKCHATVPFVGKPYINNWMGALLLCLELGLPMEFLLKKSETLTLPKGRAEVVAQCQGGAVVVDYANNPAALCTTLTWAREQYPGTVHLVFGGSGNHKSYQRKEMAETAQLLADVVYITDDNPREEPPQDIRKQLSLHCPKGLVVAGRSQAIHKAIKALQPGDVLLITGKGHETHQEINYTLKPHNDKTVVQAYLHSIQMDKAITHY